MGKERRWSHWIKWRCISILGNVIHTILFFLTWTSPEIYRLVFTILKSLVGTRADPFQVLIVLSNTTWYLKLSWKCPCYSPWWYCTLSYHANNDIYSGTMKTLGFQRFFSFEHHWPQHTFWRFQCHQYCQSIQSALLKKCWRAPFDLWFYGVATCNDRCVCPTEVYGGMGHYGNPWYTGSMAW